MVNALMDADYQKWMDVLYTICT